MPIRRKEGYTSITTKDGTGAYVAKIIDYERIRNEFMAGHPFIEFETIYGHRMVIKAGQIEAVILCSAEAVKEQTEDNREQNKEDALYNE